MPFGNENLFNAAGGYRGRTTMLEIDSVQLGDHEGSGSPSDTGKICEIRADC